MNEQLKYAVTTTALWLVFISVVFLSIWGLGTFFIWAPAWLALTVIGLLVVGSIFAAAWKDYSNGHR